MLVVSIGDIILWALGGIGLMVIGIACIIDIMGRRRERKLQEKLEKLPKYTDLDNKPTINGVSLGEKE